MMTNSKHPRYPVYVPSKGRYEACQTVQFLIRDNVPFFLVVEPSEEQQYRARFPEAEILVLPQDNMRLLGARLWIREHSIANGHARHWQLDDNIRTLMRFYKGVRMVCNANIALRACEDFTDRYENIGVSGLNYDTFVRPGGGYTPPFYLNCHVYSASLINNKMPYKWRLVYNDDTDLCLQVLSGGMCTVALNAFLAQKINTMVVKGGNTDDLYRGDGRLRMARMLERQWPYVVTTDRRFQRPQHVVRDAWRGFDTKLIRRKDIDWDNLEPVDYNMTLKQTGDEIKSPELQRMMNEYQE